MESTAEESVADVFQGVVHPLPVVAGIGLLDQPPVRPADHIEPRFRQGSEQSLQFGAERAGEAERAGPGSVAALMKLDIPPIAVELILGPGAVGVDPVDHLGGEDSEVFDRQRVRVLDEDLLPYFDVGGVEPAPIDRGQGPFDDRHLLRAHLPVLLRRRQMGPDRGQGLAEHAGPLTQSGRGPDPPGCFPRGQSEHAHQHPDHRRLGQRVRQVPRLSVTDQGMVDQRDPVPGLLDVLHHTDKPVLIECVQAGVGQHFEQMIQAGRELACGVLECGRVVDITPEAHAPILIEYTFDFQQFAGPIIVS